MTTVVHISDLHFDRVVPGCDDALVDILAELEPTVVVVSGDFTMAGRPSEFEAAGAFLDRIDAPIVACPGNHDVPAYNLWQRFVSPLGRYSRVVGSRAAESFRTDDTAVLALNSARSWHFSSNWSNGRLNRAQIRRAEAFFRDHADAPTKLLVTHHPLCIPPEVLGFRRAGGADRALAMCGRAGVHAVLTGHLHRQFATVAPRHTPPGEKPLRLLNAGTTLSDRHRLDEPNGFLVLRCRSGVEDIRAFRFNADRFEPTPLRRIDPATLGGRRTVASAANGSTQPHRHERSRYERSAMA